MKKLEKGFTLIELMIVVAIIAILAAVAAPKFGVQIRKAKDAKGLAVVGVLRSASTVQFADNDGEAETDYKELVKLIDDKSAGLVTPSTASGAATTATVDVGQVGDTIKDATISLEAVNTIDGTIDIATIDDDAKGEPWNEY